MSSERKEHVLGDLSDFPVGTHRVVKVGRREIGVFNIGGKLYGLPNVCPHQTGPLCEGKPPLGTLVARSENAWKFEWVNEGEIVACPWHGSNTTFRPEDASPTRTSPSAPMRCSWTGI
jgi:nitrite reductase (NADH) small subunit